MGAGGSSPAPVPPCVLIFESHEMNDRLPYLRRLGALLPALLLAVAIAGGADAAERTVAVSTPLQAAVDATAPGDVLRLTSGVHRGPVVLDKAVTLAGEPGAVLEGSGKGSVITVTAPDVRVEGLIIRGSGTDLPAMDSAVLVRRTAPRAVIAGNRMEHNLFGVYLHGAGGSLVRDNVIIGRRDLRMSEAGNGVSIWNAPGARIVGNDVRFGRDGIFVTTSRHNEFRDNRFRDLRFAIHYMYTHERRIIGNRTQVKYVGTRLIDWGHTGRGNYWSDNPAFDLDGDGIADRPYRPNGVMDQILWAYPQAKILANSPAVELIRWAQARFPAIRPGGVIDSAPLMRPPGAGDQLGEGDKP